MSSSCSCGIANDDESSSRVVGGSPVSSHKYPWLVLVLYIYDIKCGGSVINNLYVLTAGHCVEDDLDNSEVLPHDLINVRLGAHNIEENKEEYHDISEVIRHEDYQSDSVHDIHDIALLKLVKRIKFSHDVSPICLPRRNVFHYYGKEATVAGWGYTKNDGKISDIPREALVKVLRNKECEKMDSEVGMHFSEDKSAMFCAYTIHKDSCKGDSGGPIFISRNGSNYQIGIVSWGIDCARENTPGVYTRLTYYVKWIKKHTRDATYCTP